MSILRPLCQLLVALALAGLVAWFAFDWAFMSSSREASDELPFDRVTWLEHADPDEKRNPRWRMVPDLTRRLQAAAMSKAQVVELLGAPTFERGASLHYAVGWWGQIDPSSFEVEILQDGRVGRLRLVQH